MTAIFLRFAAALSVAAASSASAQERAEAPSLAATAEAPDRPGTQTYDQAYFAQYQVQNAEDMLQRVPGVAPILDAAGGLGTAQGRGLGSGGDQILLNGKRMAAKGQILQALRRIPASSVERIQLIRGTSSEIDVQSEGLIVNLVLKPGAAAARPVWSYELNQRFDDRGWRDVDGLVSVAGAWDRLTYVLGVERNLWTPLGLAPTGGTNDWTRRLRDEVYRYPSGATLELRPQAWRREHHKMIYTANLGYELPSGDRFRLNALHQPLPIKEIDETAFTTFGPTGSPTGAGLEYHQRDTERRLTELGAEYESRIGPGQLTLVGILRRSRVHTEDFRNRTTIAGLLTEVSRSDSRQALPEDIVRGSFAWPLFKGQDLTIGGEVARNELAQDLVVFFDRDGDRRLEPVSIPTAHAEVKEIRVEGFVVHNWKITPKLSLESSINLETSKITTNYPAIPAHTYTFPKPRFDLRYNPTPRDRLRVKVERTVSQLDFNNFVPVYNPALDRIDLGNPEVQPEKTWIYEAGYEHRLAEDNGVLEARAFYRDISDHIDRGPIATGLPVPLSAPGNIDKARLYGIELKAGVRLAALGLRDAQINGRYVRQFSKVEDPFTGRDRKLKEPWDTEFNIGFRHDLTRVAASYGINYVDTGGYQYVSDVRTVEFFERGPRVDAFVEKRLLAGISLRVEAYNLLRSHEYRRRQLYAVSQSGALSRLDRYEEIRDRRFAIRLRGKL